jgi:tetratricopeptide (TPR) repeat protein
VPVPFFREKSLEIHLELDHVEGIASQYGNLGNVYYANGDLVNAIEMYEKALELFTELGGKGGMAAHYSNLGLVNIEIGDKQNAKEYWLKALDLYEQVGIPHMIEKVQNWLDELEEDNQAEK